MPTGWLFNAAVWQIWLRAGKYAWELTLSERLMAKVILPLSSKYNPPFKNPRCRSVGIKNKARFGQLCSRLKRVTDKAYWPILPITWAWSRLFGHFLCSKWLSCHWLSDGHRNILMLALYVPVEPVQTGHPTPVR